MKGATSAPYLVPEEMKRVEETFQSLRYAQITLRKLQSMPDSAHKDNAINEIESFLNGKEPLHLQVTTLSDENSTLKADLEEAYRLKDRAVEDSQRLLEKLRGMKKEIPSTVALQREETSIHSGVRFRTLIVLATISFFLGMVLAS